MTKAKTKMTRQEYVRAAIKKVEPLAHEYRNALVRLSGIISGVTASETEKKTLHRMQTILGYQKRLLKIAAGLHAVMGELAVVQSQVE